MTENEKNKTIKRLKKRFDAIEDYENTIIEIKGKEIEAVKLVLKDIERLEDEKHREIY